MDKLKVYNRYDLSKDLSIHDRLLNLTYFEYPDVVRIFKSIDELNELNLDSYLFVRKFITDDSKNVLDDLDNLNNRNN